jgi:hypothetical protein
MKAGDEFIIDEGIRFFVHVLPQGAKIYMDQKFRDVPTHVHSGKNIYGADDVQ